MAVTGKDVGACLREARERRGLSLRQIAGATRISVQALDAIERNDIRRLPGSRAARIVMASLIARASAPATSVSPRSSIPA